MGPWCKTSVIAALTIGYWAPLAAQEKAPITLPIAYIEIADDPRYEPIRATERIVLATPHRPWTGANVAIDDAAALTRVTRTTLALERITAAPGKTADTIAAARARGVSLFLLDLPAAEIRAVAAALKGTPALAFNVSAPDDMLRRDLCAPEIVHTMPSLAMRADALLQHFIGRKWREILLLEGPEPDDAAFAAAIQRSAKKLGARIAAHTRFKLGNDPRERDLNNPALLTAISRDHDVVIVADQGLEMARQLPYRTVRPRPVAGSIGLTAEAWHWTWDRNGGPQLNGRFQTKSGGQHMDSANWAAWMAVKMISEAVLRTGATETSRLREYIVTSGNPHIQIIENATGKSVVGDGFDGAKGLAVSVRPWDQQLRQPMLLAAELSVAGTAPVDGFLHQVNKLDTLGDDEAETPCRLGWPNPGVGQFLRRSR